MKEVSRKRFYRRIRTIGKGGHGYVDEVVNEDNKKYARKKLNHLRAGKAYSRFKSEIEVLSQLHDIPGVIKILDYNLPDVFDKKHPPYYIMPLGISSTEFIKDITHDQLFAHFLKICRALEQLHSKEITHRDIKPANMLIVDGEAVLSDFGLANFPLMERKSDSNEPIGAKWTIAPEMKRISSSASYKKADVYSLAKSLWILLTGNSKAFEGQYIPYSSISLDKYIKLNINKEHHFAEWHYFSIVLLERLLVKSTSNNPDERPTITQFINELEYWLSSNIEYYERNPYEWHDALTRIFPVGIPTHCEWNGVEEILSILKVLTQYDSLNHCFLPPYGGLDLEDIKKASEPGCLQFEDMIFKPQTLFFDMIGDLEWSYFRLEFATLEPINEQHQGSVEDIYLTDTGGYLAESDNAITALSRYLNGSMVITAKTSRINMSKSPMEGYSGIHCKMTASEYRIGWELAKERRTKDLLEFLGDRIN